MKKIVQLKQWLLSKPIIFSLMFFGIMIVLAFLYSFIQAFLKFESFLPMYLIFGLSFISSVYYMIKKLPHDEMPQKDFIAITNGASIISIVSSIIAISALGLFGPGIKTKLMMMYILHPTMFSIVSLAVSFISLYILGVAISGVYAKYKRATTMGISPWKVILSMPFAFLMLWTPGYLITEKNKKSNLVIKSKWYTRFNNWVMSNLSNTLLVFLLLLFIKSIIAGLPILILTTALLIIYTLWYTKHKSDFMKNINNGYALTSVGINIAIVLAVLYIRLS